MSFTCDDYPTAYATLHSILMEIYERDIENLIDVVATPETTSARTSTRSSATTRPPRQRP